MINQQDRTVLRELAKKQLAYANSQKNLDIIDEWRRHAARKPGRPMVHIEIDTFQHEIIEPRLCCSEETSRQLERLIYHTFINQELFGDDKPIPPYFPIEWKGDFRLFGYEITRTKAQGSVGHQFNHVIGDLEEDFDKLNLTESGIDVAATEQFKSIAEDAFGDILPVKMVQNCLYAVPTQQIVHLMGMENMYIAMMDYPELFSRMMIRAADDYIAWFKKLEHGGYLLPAHSFETLGQGSFCFTDELPYEGKVTTNNVWGFLDSQETVSISPDMFAEYILPCYRKIADCYGLLSYGCCEPVHTVWECLKIMPNMRKVSISPWCDEIYMGEQLRKSNVIYHRKPSPNYLGVDAKLDEEAVHSHIMQTLHAAAGCTLEITQRDVYTVHGNPAKVRRYVEIIRKCVQQGWNP
ncbi:MAG: hypothetical protein FWG94_00210 [Oscillospiraceae bacterium]|nr:hypothetical protein [Oscillospiraceae bacterium]